MFKGLDNAILLWGSVIAAAAAWGWFSGKSKQWHEDKFNSDLRKSLELREKELIETAAIKAEVLDRREKLQAKLKSELEKGQLHTRKWLANFVAEADRVVDEAIIESLKIKQRPAVKAAEEVAAARAERRVYKEKCKFLEYQLLSYKENFPFLEDFEEVLLDDFYGLVSAAHPEQIEQEIDPVLKYIDKKAYQELSSEQRNQLALDNFLQSKLSPLEVGRLYERYIGYLYEKDGWSVEYHGIVKGYEDLGRDLICTKGSAIHVVQAKCWSKEKVIHEKHIFQLFGTTQLFLMHHSKDQLFPNNVKPVFVTTTTLSPVAKKAADWLNIEVREDFSLDKSFPMIKCNINRSTGDKIYHLPFDQQYDRTKIITSTGEIYVKTIAEAEKLGFRRAFRFSGMKGANSQL